ncbi:MAG: penicillin-binding protein 2 [Spirochaetota bacterium]|nr:MAG: penicillin-binding protein 2 [Spirochaetota bacterium]
MVGLPGKSGQTEDFKRRIYIFAAVPIIFFTVIVSVLFFLQIVRGPDYELRAKTNREQFSILPAIRGIIYDRTEKTILAYNRRSFAVTLVPLNLPKANPEKESLINELALLLNMNREEIDNKYKEKTYSKFGSYVIKTDVSFDDIVFLAEHNRDFPGVYWMSMPIRVYPYRDSLAHVLGYVGLIDEKELFQNADKGYNIESIIGKTGVEKVYDIELKGKDGYIRRIVDAKNQLTAEIIDRGAEPVPGNNVIMTIDKDIQLLTEKVLGEKTGAVVVSRPETGEILAMASYPRFDPNLFISKDNAEYFKALTLDKRKPFLNRAIQAQYPAGSIFKLVVAVAILDSEKVSEQKEFTCGGGYQMGNRFFSCWGNHGRVDLHKAITFSCDSYFYQASLILGPEMISQYAKKLGLGTKLGVDLISEMEGIVPNPDWKRENIKDIWYDGDTLNLAIGQGYLLVTPLQLNALTNLIANNGILMEPFLVKEIRSAKSGKTLYEKKPNTLIDSGIDRKHFDFIRDAMRSVVTVGTARWGGAVLSTEMAGKTSSAETSGPQTHSWFTAFAPYNSDSPDEVISITAIIERGGAGSENAAPLVAEIVEAIYGRSDLYTARRNIWKKRMELAKSKESVN